MKEIIKVIKPKRNDKTYHITIKPFMKCEIDIEAVFGNREYNCYDYYNIELDGEVLVDDREEIDIRFYKKIKTDDKSKKFEFSYCGNFSGKMNISFNKRSNADEYITLE